MFRFEITISEFRFGYYYHHTYVFNKDASKVDKTQILYVLERSIAMLHPDADIIQETITKIM